MTAVDCHSLFFFSQGCQERHDAFRNKTAAWSAFRSLDYGYTKMTIYNESHIYIRQLSDDQVRVLFISLGE